MGIPVGRTAIYVNFSHKANQFNWRKRKNYTSKIIKFKDQQYLASKLPNAVEQLELDENP